MDMARVVRGQTLVDAQSKEFVEAARAIGVPTCRIIFQHVVPNLLGIVVIYTSITVPGVILTESVLSFLGLGVQEPMTSWGVLIHDGAQCDGRLALDIDPVPRCGALHHALYCANFIGDGTARRAGPEGSLKAWSSTPTLLQVKDLDGAVCQTNDGTGLRCEQTELRTLDRGETLGIVGESWLRQEHKPYSRMMGLLAQATAEPAARSLYHGTKPSVSARLMSSTGSVATAWP
jgi:hypothetical protein